MVHNDENSTSRKINNISEYLSLNAEKHPEKPALLYPRKVTYRELERKVNQLCFGLENSGIEAGTKTLVMVPAGIDFFVLIFALFRIGAIPVMIDPGMGIVKMVSVLEELEPEAFVGIPKAHLMRLAYNSVFAKVKTNIITGAAGFGRTRCLIKLGKDTNMKYAASLIDPDELAAIFFTSGSTGPSKGVIYTSGMLMNQIEITKTQFNISSDEIDLCTFPLLGLFAVCHGNSSVLADMDMMHPASLHPEKLIRNIREFNCTQMFGSPMVLNKLADYCLRKGLKLNSLRNIISAGAPVHRDILESFRKLISNDADIHTPYGATEALPVTDITASELQNIYSVRPENENGVCIGYPVEPLKVNIIGITDKPVESYDTAKLMLPEEIGEIVVNGPWVTPGYFKNSEASLLSRIRDNEKNETWHRMGDLGKIDTNGILWFYGRKTHRVITLQGTLFTIPCEAVFNRHPDVSRSALVGIRMDESGFIRPVICIQLKSGFHPTEKIKKELYDLGSSFPITKGISDILFIKDFPVDPRHNAKILREKLALWAEKRIK